MSDASFMTNYPQSDRISQKVFNFFCSEILYALSNPGSHKLWIISPWIRNTTFDLSTRGNVDHLFPNNSGQSISLLQILERLTELNVQICIVCKPPHTLYSPSLVSDYLRIEQTQKSMDSLHSDIQSDLENIHALSESVKDMISSLSQRISELYKTECSLSTEILERDTTSILTHAEMLDFLTSLKMNRKIRIVFNERLHAKLIVGKYAALFGSANVTKSGLNNNDELVAYVTDSLLIDELVEKAKSFSGESDDAKQMKSSWIIDSRIYSAETAIKKRDDVTDAQIERIARSSFNNELYDFLERAGLSVCGRTESKAEDKSLRSAESLTDLEVDTKSKALEEEPVQLVRYTLDEAKSLSIESLHKEDWRELVSFNPTQLSAVQTYIHSGKVFSGKHRDELQAAYLSALENGYLPYKR